MRSFTKTLIGAGVAVLLAASANAQSFSFTTSSSAGLAPVDVGGGTLVRFIPQISPLPASCSGGGTSITLINLETTAVSTGPTSTAVNFPYTITLNVQDPVTLANVSTQTINLRLGGTAGTDPVTGSPAASMTNTYLSGFPFTFTTSTGDIFDVSLFSTPNPPTLPGGLRGAVLAQVVCRTPTIPEPGSLALLGTGLLPLAGLLRRRNRK